MITIPLSVVISLLLLHVVGDFILQSGWMALNKSKHWDPLVLHTSIYSLCFYPLGWRFVGITFLLHTLTDAITSRITARLWFIDLSERVKGTVKWPTFEFARVYPRKRYWFFLTVGIDQFIHAITLFCTYKLLNP